MRDARGITVIAVAMYFDLVLALAIAAEPQSPAPPAPSPSRRVIDSPAGRVGAFRTDLSVWLSPCHS